MWRRGGSLLLRPPAFAEMSNRFLSANEAAVALRPFYFAVHPDRFALHPQAREQNEKSLQIFNGYLNDLYTSPPQSKVEIKFAIAGKEKGEFEQIVLCLTGRDPHSFVRHALEKARLSTQSIPKTKPMPERQRAWSMPQSSRPFGGSYDDPMLQFIRRRKRAPVRPTSNDLGALLKDQRNLAMEKSKQMQEMRAALIDEIEDVKWRTGASEVLWQMDWAESHMRRCITMLNRMLDLASPELRKVIVQALYKHKLRLGRGSYICCDGSVQFGADNVPEQWEKVCLEASVRRTQLPVLRETKAALSGLLGNANILTADQQCLGKTLQQLQTLIIRIRAQEPEILKRLSTLGKSTTIEVATAYDELAVGADGRLLVPCTVALPYLLEFLHSTAEESRRTNRNAQQLKADLEEIKDECIRAHSLSGLTWDGEGLLSGQALLESLRRLSALDPKPEALKGLHLHISSHPAAHIMSDGRISTPLDWKFS